MTEQEITVYAKIYDIVSEEIVQSGGAFPYKKETFLKGIGSHPQIVHVSEFIDLPNEIFYQAVFMNTVKRLPDEKQIAFWKQKESLPVTEFQKAVLREVMRSRVAAINHIQFVDDPYGISYKGIRYYFWGLLYGVTNKPSLRIFCRKLPTPIQNVIKKVLL